MQELTIKDILKILKKRWWMIVAFCIIVTVAAGVYYQRQPDEYTAQATLCVLPNYLDGMQQTRFDLYSGEQWASIFTELISTPTIATRSMELMKDQGSGFASVRTSISTNSNILYLSATGREPELCMLVANTVSQVFIEYVNKELVKQDMVSLFAEATLPMSPSGPARMKNTLLAGAVSLMLAVGVALAIELINTTLRTPDAVESTLGLPVLASIQNYKREIERFIQKRLPGEMLSKGVPIITKENIKTLITNLQFATIAHPTKTLLVTSSFAGEGKSSLLLLLAEAFADLGKRVLVVDMDMRNPSIGQYLGARGRNDLFDYMVGHSRLEETICKTGNSSIHFIDSRHRLASVSQIVNFEVFDKFLDTIKRLYDLVLFDTPPLGLFIDAAALANKMDATLLVVGSGMGDRSVIRDVVGQLKKAEANILGVAMNFVEHPRYRRHYYGKVYGYSDEKKEPPIPFKKQVQET
jgi:capsular exopolysaccharide synthesis family protein